MLQKKQGKSGGARKIGRNLKKCQGYRSRDTRYWHKLARILKSNGKEAARIYRLGHARGLRVAV